MSPSERRGLESKQFLGSSLRILFALVTCLLVSCSPESVARSERSALDALGTEKVSALARIEPGQGVIDVGAAPGQRLARLEVDEGQAVSAGRVVAILGDHEQLVAGLSMREAAVRQAELAHRRRREMDPLEIASAEAEVRMARAETVLEETELERLEMLREQRIDSARSLDRQIAATALARERLRGAEITLSRARKEQELALLESEAALNTARRELDSAHARQARSEIRAPIDGRILKIFVWPGEVIDSGPILRMGDVERIYAVAEVYETDVRFVRPGQQATIESPAFEDRLTGTVERVGSLIYKNDLLDIDPAAETDSRVIEVRIRLDDSTVAANYVHHQVNVIIDVSSGQ